MFESTILKEVRSEMTPEEDVGNTQGDDGEAIPAFREHISIKEAQAGLQSYPPAELANPAIPSAQSHVAAPGQPVVSPERVVAPDASAPPAQNSSLDDS